MDNLTIIVPLYRQPNHLATVLYGLVKNSVYKNRIIVVWSDPAQFNHAKMQDFMVNMNLNRFHKYDSVEDYIAKRGDWAAEHNIEFLDVTEQAKIFQKEFADGKYNPYTKWEDGVDTAWKDNIGIAMSNSEYTMPNYDADFFPSPGWDKILMDTLAQLPPKSIVVPVQCQPLNFDKDPEWKYAWNDCKYIACARLTIPIVGREQNSPRGGNSIYEWEMEEFFNRWKENVILKEKPGARSILHHFPVLYRTEELKNVLGPEHIPLSGAGYDLRWDDDAGKKGFTKYTPRNSWCFHKAFVAVQESDV